MQVRFAIARRLEVQLRRAILNRRKILTTDQQRSLYELCWQFEDSWIRGERIPIEKWLSKAGDIPQDVALSELSATQRELENGQSGEKHSTAPIEDDRYEFIEEIARGGSAVVWRVRDRHLGRETAVKYLLDSQDNFDMRNRLEREARLCARLAHPGIVPIHELSNFADQRPFVSMKLVEGKTLLQLLESDPPIPIKTSIEIFTKACQAIAYAHEKGVIHRDLKPGNIMVGSFGEVQVMDWGLAKDLNEKWSETPVNKSLDPSGDTWGDAIQSEATIVGSVFGTIAYMSPEQANGKILLIDKWSDVFSLGAMLCRLLTGIPPYQDIDRSLEQDSMLARAQSGDLIPAFERLAKAKPHRLAELAIRCMAVHPNDRPSDAGEIVKELVRIRKADQRTLYTLRFLAVASSIFFIVAGAIFLSNRNRNSTNDAPVVFQDYAPPLTTYAIHEIVKEQVTLDSEAAKILLKSDRKEVVLDNYRTILDDNPDDEKLYFSVLLALMNSERWVEGEDVARDLIQMQPEHPDYHFFLSESFFLRGRYEEAKKVMLTSKALIDKGISSPYPIDDSLSKCDRYLAILQKISEDPTPSFESLNSKELLEVGDACGRVGKFALANGYYNRSLAKVTDTYQQTLSRHNLLLQYAHRNLRDNKLTDDSRNVLSRQCLEWLREQFDSMDKLGNKRATEMLYLLNSPTFEFARKLVDDTRVESDVREGLKSLFSSIQGAKSVAR